MSPLMPTALVLSPHLDDAAFSCGGLMALLADAGWRTVMATAFTRSVPHPTGFALACQTDKGLAPDVDYMALRRDEDRAAAAFLGAEPRWLDLPEAPHRGYHSAPALFGPVLHADDIWRRLESLIAGLAAELRPDLVLAPQGLGGHVDHRQMIQAVLSAPRAARGCLVPGHALRHPQPRCLAGRKAVWPARVRHRDRAGAGAEGGGKLRLCQPARLPVRRPGCGGGCVARVRVARGRRGAGREGLGRVAPRRARCRREPCRARRSRGVGQGRRA